MKRLLVAAFLMLAGCASGGGVIAPEAARDEIPDGMAKVIFYRPWAWTGSLIGLQIYFSEQKVAEIGTNEMTYVYVTPGQYYPRATFGRTAFGLDGYFGYAEGIMDISAGKVYIVESMAGSMRQSYADASALNSLYGRTPQGGAVVRAGFEPTRGREELRGYKYVEPLVKFPAKSEVPASSWRR